MADDTRVTHTRRGLRAPSPLCASCLCRVPASAARPIATPTPHSRTAATSRRASGRRRDADADIDAPEAWDDSRRRRRDGRGRRHRRRRRRTRTSPASVAPGGWDSSPATHGDRRRSATARRWPGVIAADARQRDRASPASRRTRTIVPCARSTTAARRDADDGSSTRFDRAGDAAARRSSTPRSPPTRWTRRNARPATPRTRSARCSPRTRTRCSSSPAGNEGNDNDDHPGATRAASDAANLICVGAYDARRTTPPAARATSAQTSVDLFAPGRAHLDSTTRRPGGYCRAVQRDVDVGAPFVSAEAALLFARVPSLHGRPRRAIDLILSDRVRPSNLRSRTTVATRRASPTPTQALAGRRSPTPTTTASTTCSTHCPTDAERRRPTGCPRRDARPPDADAVRRRPHRRRPCRPAPGRPPTPSPTPAPAPARRRPCASRPRSRHCKAAQVVQDVGDGQAQAATARRRSRCTWTSRSATSAQPLPLEARARRKAFSASARGKSIVVRGTQQVEPDEGHVPRRRRAVVVGRHRQGRHPGLPRSAERRRLGVLAFGDSITNGGGELQWGVALQSWALWVARGLGPAVHDLRGRRRARRATSRARSCPAFARAHARAGRALRPRLPVHRRQRRARAGLGPGGVRAPTTRPRSRSLRARCDRVLLRDAPARPRAPAGAGRARRPTRSSRRGARARRAGARPARLRRAQPRDDRPRAPDRVRPGVRSPSARWTCSPRDGMDVRVRPSTLIAPGERTRAARAAGRLDLRLPAAQGGLGLRRRRAELLEPPRHVAVAQPTASSAERRPADRDRGGGEPARLARRRSARRRRRRARANSTAQAQRDARTSRAAPAAGSRQPGSARKIAATM